MLEWFWKLREKRDTKKRQSLILKECGCICFCPTCKDPLNDQAKWSYLNEDEGVYSCSKCGDESLWNFNAIPGALYIGPIYWNPYSKVYQDHRDGTIYE